MTRTGMVYGNISAARQRILRFFNWVTVLLVVSLILQVAGCFSPGWMYVKLPAVTHHMGLWYTTSCEHDNCETKSIEELNGDVLESDALHLRELRGETISGIIFCLAAIIAVRISRTRLYTPNSNNVLLLLIISGVSILLSGILATTAAGRMADTIKQANDLYTYFGDDSPYKFPYSLFMTGVGGVLGLISFLLLLASQPWQARAENQQPPQQPPQPGVYPAQTMPMQTAYPPGQPQMYAIATAPPLPQTDKSQAPPSYY